MTLLLLLLAEAAVLPKVGPVDHLHEIVVEAIRNCPKPIAGEVVVCAPDTGAAPPYRLPKLTGRYAKQGFDPKGPTDSVSRERHRLLDAGGAGIGSCTNVGAGGWTGCLSQQWRKNEEQNGFRHGDE